MRLELTGRHVTITADMRRTVQRHLAHLDRLLTNHAVSSQIVVIHEKSHVRVEVTLHARAEHFFHAHAAAADWERAFTVALRKIERQAQKLSDKWHTRKRRNGAVRRAAVQAVSQVDSADARVRIIRARQYAVKPMSVDDAAMEVGDDPNAFLVFRNTSNDAVTVLYRRPDGHLGVIEPKA